MKVSTNSKQTDRRTDKQTDKRTDEQTLSRISVHTKRLKCTILNFNATYQENKEWNNKQTRALKLFFYILQIFKAETEFS
jgi:NifU-like protein involved in Fe-S cluster formation